MEDHGAMLAKYDREKLIGSGTFGKVWLIRSQNSGHSYVLKEVQLKTMSSSEKQQAVTEVSVLARCRHRNIVRYKEACIELEKGILSIIMEYADGGDLYTVIKRQKGCFFEEKDVLSWFVQVTLALEYIHKRNILHRDLKSQNIFLTKEKLIKVGDFGIARVLTAEKELATTAIGTPYYLSPEICQRKPYNHKSDVWALGCVLFEMAALCHPFQAQNFPQLVSAILKVKHRSLPSYCSPLMQDLVSVLLQLDPGERPDAHEILSIPALQPHIMRYLNSYSSDSTEKSGPKKSQERSSFHDVSRNPKDTSDLKRSASISSGNKDESKVLKTNMNKESVSQKGRSNSSPRTSDVKNPKPRHFPLSNIVNLKNRRVQSRHSTPCCINSSASRKAGGVPSSSLSEQHCHSTYTVSCASPPGNRTENAGEPDCGYLSHETQKNTAVRKAQSGRNSKSQSSQPISEDRKSASSLSQGICDDSDTSADNVFVEDAKPASPRDLSRKNSLHKNVRSNSFGEGCPHELQCSRCMLDTLWKHRIRGTPKIFLDLNENCELKSKLQSVFGADRFCRIYEALVSEWEDSKNPVSLHNEVQSLDTMQLQYIPLFLQLIQIDMLSNPPSTNSVRL